MNRRSLIRSLFALPALAVTVRDVPVSERLVQLPVGCDLSLNSLKWALELGWSKNFGKPLEVLINPEDKWIAEKLLYSKEKPYSGDSNLLEPPYRVVYGNTLGVWRVVFEKGVVESRGPF